MSRSTQRPGRAHKEIAREAGMRPVSIISIVAGVFCAYGAFTLVAAVAGAVLDQAGVDTDFRSNDWAGSGAVAGLVSALVLLVAYLFGGYVTGRMARRRGALHGVLVAVVSFVIGAVVGGLVSALTDDADLTRNLRSIGIPTDTDQISGPAVAAVIASLAAVVVGAVLGGILGERWHAKLARRAADPEVGPAAEARARAEREDAERDRRIASDVAVQRDVDLTGRGPDRDQDGRDDRAEDERSTPPLPPQQDPQPAGATRTFEGTGWTVPADRRTDG